MTKKTRLRLHLEHDLLNTRITVTPRARDPRDAKKEQTHKLTSWQKILCGKLQLTEGGTMRVTKIAAEDYVSRINNTPEVEARILKAGQVNCIEIIWKHRLKTK